MKYRPCPCFLCKLSETEGLSKAFCRKNLPWLVELASKGGKLNSMIYTFRKLWQFQIFRVILILNLFHFPESEVNAAVSIKATQGVLNLRDWDFRKNQSVRLDGEWEFYWSIFLNPLPANRKKTENRSQYITVPSHWQKTINENNPNREKFSSYGYATYRLVVLLPENYPPLSLAMNDAGMAHKVFINGKQVASNGIPGKSETETVLKQQYLVFHAGDDKSRELEIIIHISNFQYKKAGLWHTTYLGESVFLETNQMRSILLDIIVFSSVLIMGLYHLGLYASRQKDKSPLWFGLFCLLIALRTVSIKERIILDAIPHLSFSLVHRMEYAGFYLSTSMFIHFIRTLYPKQFSLKVFYAFTIFFYMAAILVISSPIQIYSQSLIPVQIVLLAAILYIVYVMIRAIMDRALGAVVFMLGLTLFFFTIGHDILRTMGILHTPFLSSYGLLFFIFMQAIVLSQRFANAFVRSENLSYQLRELNESLEVRVLKRTRDLNRNLSILKHDLNFAKHIQLKLLPLHKKKADKLQFAHVYRPRDEVGGDIFDIHIMSDRVRVLLADATGHGVQAALVTMLIKSEYEGIKNSLVEPSELLSRLNKIFINTYDTSRHLFSCVIADIRTETETLVYSAAGHPDQLLISGRNILKISNTGRIQGFTADSAYTNTVKEFHPGDTLLLYTDGLFEDYAGQTKPFGQEGLYQCVRKFVNSSQNDNSESSLETLLSEVEKTADLRHENLPQQDDITILGIEFIK